MRYSNSLSNMKMKKKFLKSRFDMPKFKKSKKISLIWKFILNFFDQRDNGPNYISVDFNYSISRKYVQKKNPTWWHEKTNKIFFRLDLQFFVFEPIWSI